VRTAGAVGCGGGVGVGASGVVNAARRQHSSDRHACSPDTAACGDVCRCRPGVRSQLRRSGCERLVQSIAAACGVGASGVVNGARRQDSSDRTPAELRSARPSVAPARQSEAPARAVCGATRAVCGSGPGCLRSRHASGADLSERETFATMRARPQIPGGRARKFRSDRSGRGRRRASAHDQMRREVHAQRVDRLALGEAQHDASRLLAHAAQRLMHCRQRRREPA